MLMSNQARVKRIQQEKTIDELKKGERVNVKISPMHIFLLRDGKRLPLFYVQARLNVGCRDRNQHPPYSVPRLHSTHYQPSAHA